ncbi:MAG: DUF4156 domain-containing protein [Proteobacteria bacterium]|nr:MAG: DUF4156 domain-containing protein [Pseudomonadota bacterium]
MKHTNRKSLIAFVSFLLSTAVVGCSSQPVVPEAKNVKVAREEADSDCREIGRVQGSVKTATGTIEQAIEDMKLDAARKGANYVRMEQTGAMGTSASGTAYQCR